MLQSFIHIMFSPFSQISFLMEVTATDDKMRGTLTLNKITAVSRLQPVPEILRYIGL